MKKILIIALMLFAGSVSAQEGIQFFQGSWNEALAKAKAENKLIFVDIYTSWCGPCKLMAKDIFPLRSVGEKFNKNFINYKIDAEKGEGIMVAKTYKVNAYPTYLFVNGAGVLYYTSLGSMPETAFIREAENALMEFGDPKPLPMWQSEYPSKKGDKEFLMAYMKKRSKLRLPGDSLIDQYAALSSSQELLSKETLTYLIQQEGAKVDGAFFNFLSSNKAAVASVLAQPEPAVNAMLSRFASGDLKRAVAKKDIRILDKIIAAKRALSPAGSGSEDIDQLRVSYYAQTKNEKALIQALEQYSKSLLSYDLNIIKQSDAQQLKAFEAALAAGQMKDATPEQIEQSRKFMGSSAATNYAYRVRDMAASAYRHVNDKATLNRALKWMDVAAQFSDNFTIDEMRAGLLHKLGRRTEAIKHQQQAIAAFSAIKMDNEIITTRLNNGLQKIRDNQPTWIEEQAATTTGVSSK